MRLVDLGGQVIGFAMVRMKRRRACERRADLWNNCAVPREEARCRLLLGMVYRAHGNDELSRLELETASAAFERLGAIPDRDRARELLQRHP